MDLTTRGTILLTPCEYHHKETGPLPRKKPEVQQLFRCPRCSNTVQHLADVPAIGILCKKAHRYPSGRVMPDDDEVWMEPVRIVKRSGAAAQ
jgi:hypothetical protein